MIDQVFDFFSGGSDSPAESVLFKVRHTASLEAALKAVVGHASETEEAGSGGGGGGGFSASDLPGNDPFEKLCLARVLVERGLLLRAAGAQA